MCRIGAAGSFWLRPAPRNSEKLAAIKAQAEANGVTDLVWLSGAEARALEPALAAEHALLSPSTGVIDSHALCWRFSAMPNDTEQ